MLTVISNRDRRNRRASIALGVACVWLTGMANAGTLLDYETLSRNNAAHVTVAIQGGRVRIDQRTGGWTIFDRDKNVFLLVDPAKRSYVEATHEEMARYSTQLAAARSLLDDKLKGLTPEQRITFEKMMGGAASLNAPILFQSTNEKRVINGFTCTGGRLVRKSYVHENACLAQPADIKMSEADYATLRSMYKFIHDMQQKGGLGWLPDMSEINGIPVEVLNPQGDRQRLISAKNEALPESDFSAPAGYTREGIADLLIRSQKH